MNEMNEDVELSDNEEDQVVLKSKKNVKKMNKNEKD